MDDTMFPESRKWGPKYTKNGVRWTLRWTFRWTKLCLQKRNVAIRWTLRWTLLTLFFCDKWGELPKMTPKNGIFERFRGVKFKKRRYSRGETLPKAPIYGRSGRFARK